MRVTYVWDKEQKKLVERGQFYRESFPAPFIVEDTISAQLHPGTCKWVDSRSKFKMMTKACGLSERGPEQMKDQGPKYKEMDSHSFERDVKIAYEQCRSGTAPLSEYDRKVCRSIDERLRNR